MNFLSKDSHFLFLPGHDFFFVSILGNLHVITIELRPLRVLTLVHVVVIIHVLKLTCMLIKETGFVAEWFCLTCTVWETTARQVAKYE